MKRTIHLLLELATVLLMACGGGSNSDTAPQVGFVVTNPKSINIESYERNKIPDILISGRVTGNATALNGKSLYFVIGLPDAFLFSSKPAFNIDSSGLSGSIQLFGAIPPDGAKTYSGTMTVLAYLDSSFQNQLKVENGIIPYTVRVKTGLKVENSEITFRTPFGTRPPEITVPIRLPEDVASWNVYSDRPTFYVQKADDGSSNIIVSVSELVLPSTSTGTLQISAITQGGTTLYTHVGVNYITDPSDVPFVLSKPNASFELKYGNQNFSDQISIYGQFPKVDSDRFRYIGATYTWPSNADGNSLNSRWLYIYNMAEISSPRPVTRQYFIDLKAIACYGSNCLPVGTYTANLHYQYSPAIGPVVDVYLPVTMNIVP